MATFQDMMKTVGGAALKGVQAVQKVIPAAQQAIVNWAAQNPSAAGNILKATGGSFGAMVQKSPAQVMAQLAAPTVQKTVANVQKAVAPVIAATRKIATPAKATVPVPKIITPVQPIQTKVQQPTGGGFAQYNKPAPQVQTKVLAPSGSGTGGSTATVTGGQASNLGTSSNYLGQARNDVTAYYQSLLEDSNWNIDEAKRRMEEDYKLGVRGAREASDVNMRQQMDEAAPSALMSSMDELNKRGLVSRPTGDLAPVTAKLSTGETITAKTPNITKTFGGLAGEQFGRVQTAQQARAEAIGKALALRDEELAQNKGQKARETEQTAKTEKTRIEQEKEVAASKLASQRYAEQIAGKQAGLQTAYS
jgi:hypothetical protein